MPKQTTTLYNKRQYNTLQNPTKSICGTKNVWVKINLEKNDTHNEQQYHYSRQSADLVDKLLKKLSYVPQPDKLSHLNYKQAQHQKPQKKTDSFTLQLKPTLSYKQLEQNLKATQYNGLKKSDSKKSIFVSQMI